MNQIRKFYFTFTSFRFPINCMIAVKFYQFIYSFINKRKLISNNNKRQFFINKKYLKIK